MGLQPGAQGLICDGGCACLRVIVLAAFVGAGPLFDSCTQLLANAKPVHLDFLPGGAAAWSAARSSDLLPVARGAFAGASLGTSTNDCCAGTGGVRQR